MIKKLINLKKQLGNSGVASPVLVIIIIIVVAAGIGAGALYTRVWDPSWSPFRPNPDEVMEQMTLKMAGVNSFHGNGNFSVSAKSEENENMDLSMNFDQDSDLTDFDNPKSQGKVNLSTSIPEYGSFSVQLEMKNTGKDFYFKISNFQPVSVLMFLKMAYGIDGSSLQNQWIKVGEELLSESSTPTATKYNQEVNNKMKQLLTSNKLYYVKEELSDQVIDGKKNYHYIVGLDKEKTKQVIPEILKTSMEASNDSLETVTALNSNLITQRASNMFVKFLDGVGELEVELWIEKEELFLSKMKFDKGFDISKISQGESKGTVNISSEINYSNFNQPIEIEIPSDATSIQEIIPTQ